MLPGPLLLLPLLLGALAGRCSALSRLAPHPGLRDFSFEGRRATEVPYPRLMSRRIICAIPCPVPCPIPCPMPCPIPCPIPLKGSWELMSALKVAHGKMGLAQMGLAKPPLGSFLEVRGRCSRPLSPRPVWRRPRGERRLRPTRSRKQVILAGTVAGLFAASVVMLTVITVIVIVVRSHI